MLTVVTDCRRSLKWGCRGRLVLDLNLGTAAIEKEDYVVLGTKGEDHVVWGEKREPRSFGVLLFAIQLRHRRDFAGKKRGERTLAGGL